MVGLLWLSCSTAWAQFDSSLQQADRLLSYKAYGRAIDAYTQLLAEPDKLTDAQRSTVQGQLAYAYKQVGDGVKAERFYREALTYGSGENLQQLLSFAQTLAGNGKFQEAQQHYERYLKLKEKIALERPQPPSAALGSESSRKIPANYRLDYLALNSRNDEFSPTFYVDGLVYVSGSKSGLTRTPSGQSGGGYLDLFYAPNRNSLKGSPIAGAEETTKKVATKPVKPARQVAVKKTTKFRNSVTAQDDYESIKISDGLGYKKEVPVKFPPARRFSNTLNSRYNEGPATFSRDGAWIIFTRNDQNEVRGRKNAEGSSKLKLYTARQQNGAWTNVAPLPFNNDEYSVGHPTLSRDEHLLYFASDMPGGYGGTDLYVSRYENGKWGRPINLGEDINTKGNELFPFVDDGGNLYFSTNGRKGLGELDLFFASLTTLDTGLVVQSVEHLDAPFNSPKDDFGLITDVNRRGGYFSSNRREGNDDIYRFVRESSPNDCRDLTVRFYDSESNASLDSVSVAIKSKSEGQVDQIMVTDSSGFVRLCLNSNNDFMIKASRDGYVSNTVGFTTRALTNDQSSQLEIGMIKPTALVDTLSAELDRPESTGLSSRPRIRGVVVGENSQRPIAGVTVRLRNECDHTLSEQVTEADGHYAFDLVEGCDYTLIASKPAFGTNTSKIKRIPKKSKPKEISADLRMLNVGDVVTIDNIYYDLDRFSLRPDASRELEKLVATMRKYPSLSIEVRSHTDSRGSAEQNKLLSTQRAKAVADYLATRGISRRRMATIGMGESQLVNNCTDEVICTEAEHQRNRRTEFRVMDIK